MDHIMELIDIDQFADLNSRDTPVKINLFRRYKDLNSFLLEARPTNLVVVGIHARMFYV